MGTVRKKTDWDAMPLEELEKRMDVRQKRFAEELDVGGSATEAYIRAGYSPKSAGAHASELVKNPKFAAYRRKRTEDLYKKRGITTAWVGERLVEVVQRSMQAEPHMSWDRDKKAYVPDGTWVEDNKNAVAALKAIGESLGMFKATAPEGGKAEVNILMPPGGSEEYLK